MQLAGPGVFGPPKDRDAAMAVLREAVDLGITHIDTADFYGPYVTNELIRDGARARTPTTCTSSPRSAPAGTRTAAGCMPARPRSCASRSTTTCVTSGSRCSTS